MARASLCIERARKWRRSHSLKGMVLTLLVAVIVLSALGFAWGSLGLGTYRSFFDSENSAQDLASEVSSRAEVHSSAVDDCYRQFNDEQGLLGCLSNAAADFADSIFTYANDNFDIVTYDDVPACVGDQLSTIFFLTDVYAIETIRNEFAAEESNFDEDRAAFLAFLVAGVHARELFTNEVAIRAMFDLETPFPTIDVFGAQTGLVEVFREAHEYRTSSPALAAVYLDKLDGTLAELGSQASRC